MIGPALGFVPGANARSRKMNKETALTAQDVPQHGQPPFPYVVVRLFPATYERMSVRFTLDKGGPLVSGEVLEREVLVQEEREGDRRRLLVNRLIELSSASGRRMCAVFGPADAVYVEPDGAERPSADIPIGGMEMWPD